MNDLIERIIRGTNLDEVYEMVRNNIFIKGPVDINDLEILSYLCEYDRERFDGQIDYILNDLALFYKKTDDIQPRTVKDLIVCEMKDAIKDSFPLPITPLQADIINAIKDNDCFSFSSPTSTGKSFVLMDLIKKSSNDVVVIVPSRALINEYFVRLNETIQDRSINILTFIDRINTAHSKKNIFVVTPERCRELFAHIDDFIIDLFLFDEAQLTNETNIRGLLFDSIVRRCHKHFPTAKLIFAHPFVANPEAQIEKNHLDDNLKHGYYSYQQRSVGQMFLCTDNHGRFFHCGLNKNLMGNKRIRCNFDPIERILQRGKGSILFYVSKNSILTEKCLEEFKQYVKLCRPINNKEVDEIISKLEEYTGGNTIERRFFYSQFIDLLRRGIVVHHGSLPMKSRMLIEKYIKQGFCRICFATSTLEQGVNMPFEAIYLNKFRKKDILGLKNIIGRAGRSSAERKYDYGYVIVKSYSNMSDLRTLLSTEDKIKNVSSLDLVDELDSDYRDFKDAVNSGTINDNYNLTPNELTILTSEKVHGALEDIKGNLIYNGRLVNKRIIEQRGFTYNSIIGNFINIYQIYLQRDLSEAERYVLKEAIDIMLFRIFGNTFKKICWMRYSWASRLFERRQFAKEGKKHDKSARFTVCYKAIPDSKIKNYSLFPQSTRAEDVSYDMIIYDTYDYLDKLVNFKLADIFYAAAMEYYGVSKDEDMKKIALLVRFGTFDERHIWMLRYGLSFEDIEKLDKSIDHIDETGIVFNSSIMNVDTDTRSLIERYIN